MRIRAKIVIALLVSTLVVAGCAWVLVARPSGSGGSSGAPDATATAAHAFFARYVDPDGRVVRRDQGGDTVSEGQSYALLLAAVTNDRPTFDLVWQWTAGHLQRPDGLLSWRYADGAVADPMSATDADVQAAWALSIAARRFGPDPYTANARSVATAVLDHESVLAGGRRYLAAGPWATGDPAVVNASYAVPEASITLARITGDPRWDDVVSASRALVDNLGRQTALPPDWVSLDQATGAVVAIAPPDGSAAAPRYGLDAARLVAWFATDCDAASRATAATWSTTLSDQPLALARDLSGAPQAIGDSAASEVAAATAARADGDNDRAKTMLDDARSFDQQHPTYYGSAWVALGAALADSTAPLGCPTP